MTLKQVSQSRILREGSRSIRSQLAQSREAVGSSQTTHAEMERLRARLKATLEHPTSDSFTWLEVNEFRRLTPAEKERYVRRLADHLLGRPE